MRPQVKTIIPAVLDWYDVYGRDLPWRVRGMPHPDAYHVWLSEIMLQQTTVPAVKPYFEKFTDKYPTVHDLARASSEDVMRDWAGLGYYSRARNLHAAAKAVSAAGGDFPRDKAGLIALPGIGEYTAGAIAAIAFGARASVVDGNIERILTRLYAIETPLPASKPDIKAVAETLFHADANTRPHDLPQALMDLATAICTPKAPKCVICPISKQCAAYRLGIQDDLPKRMKKPERPKRKGFVYWVEDDRGRVLVETRPPKGLLGGMTGLPTSEWNDDPQPLAIFEGAPERSKVKHVFTHFELTLIPVRAKVRKTPPGYRFVDPRNAGFPSVFQKVAKYFSA